MPSQGDNTLGRNIYVRIGLVEGDMSMCTPLDYHSRSYLNSIQHFDNARVS